MPEKVKKDRGSEMERESKRKKKRKREREKREKEREERRGLDLWRIQPCCEQPRN